MDLASYFYEKNPISLEEFNSLHLEILELLKAFEGYSTNPFSVQEVSDILLTERPRLMGFAKYLNDFQGIYDSLFEPYTDLFCDLARALFDCDFPFNGQLYRLLEIGKCHFLAKHHPEEDNLAQFILNNFAKFKNTHVLQVVYRNLRQAHKAQQLKPNSPAELLYRLTKANLPFWKR